MGHTSGSTRVIERNDRHDGEPERQAADHQAQVLGAPGHRAEEEQREQVEQDAIELDHRPARGVRPDRGEERPGAEEGKRSRRDAEQGRETLEGML